MLPGPRFNPRRSEAPRIHGRDKMEMTIPLLLICVASQPPPRIAIILTTPNGILNRMVLNLSKPNDWTIEGPKVPIPPDGMLLVVSGVDQEADIHEREAHTRSPLRGRTSTTTLDQGILLAHDPSAISVR